ncbi:MAG TPA: hypothetical protein VM118_08320 [Acidobacteriota bacterium]|nr:hypothetical protein [Acidobacteriota bacterium]
MRGRERTITAALVILAFGALAVGCGTEGTSGPATGAAAAWKVVFDLTTPSPYTPGDLPSHLQSGYGEDGPDSVTIMWGGVMIRSVRFDNGDHATVDTNITAEDESRDRNDPDINLDGPYVFAINGTRQSLGTDNVVPGHYNKVVFVLEPASAGDDLGGFDDLLGNSLVVAGKVWHNGVARGFKFTTDYSSEYAVGGAFALNSGTTENLELRFNAGRWFKRANCWLDPSDSVNRPTILDNIRRNIRAGRDVSQ